MIDKVAESYINQISDACSRIKPRVAIMCLTYNHAQYLRSTLDGFVMQKTTFPFVVIVHEDASPDEDALIIKEYATKYPDIILPIFEAENQYSKWDGSLTQIINASIAATNAEYNAFCEGDDYWIDETKLQRQVDFLDNNPEFGMCYTDFNIKNEVSGRYTKDVFKNHTRGFQPVFDSPEEFILNQAYMCPPSWVFRNGTLAEDIFNSLDGTFVYFTHFLCTTKVKYLDFTSTVYRVIAESASHSADFEKLYHRMQDLLRIKLKLIDHYNLNQEYKDLCIEHHYRLYLVDLIIYGKRDDVRNAKRYIRNKSLREKILLICNDLHLYALLPIVRNLLPKRF